MEKISITHMSNAHGDWLRGLDFYRDEIRILKNRLTEVAGKNSHPDVLKQVEHYENQFEIQSEDIHRLRQNIKSNIRNTAAESHISGAGYIDGALLTRHHPLGQQFETEEKTVKELRQEFNQFAAAWM
jgi:septation ring formation regulator EzrA